MSHVKTKSQVTKHKESALSKLDSYLDSQINSTRPSDRMRADKLAYWIEDYTSFLKKEATYDPSKGINYRRGDIVKVHLGFRLGSEEGGLHFGIVLDVNNSKRSDTITIIPLTSQKENKPVHPTSVALGTEVFRAIVSKHDKLVSEITTRVQHCQKTIDELKNVLESSESVEELSEEARQAVMDKIQVALHELDVLEKKRLELEEVRSSIVKMKDGSIALVNQIVTISKMRIHDPIYSNNVLYGIRLSPTTLSMIDEKIAELYLGKPKK